VAGGSGTGGAGSGCHPTMSSARNPDTGLREIPTGSSARRRSFSLCFLWIIFPAFPPRYPHAPSTPATRAAADLPPRYRGAALAADHLPTPRRAPPHRAGVAATLPTPGGSGPGPRLCRPGPDALGPGRRSAAATPGSSHLGGRTPAGRTPRPPSPGRRPPQQSNAGTLVPTLPPPARAGGASAQEPTPARPLPA
jgi:hypothetical protein